MIFRRKQSGFSLLETLIVLAIMAAVLAKGVAIQIEATRVENGEKFGKQMHQVIQVIDKRFFLEGYEDELWVDVDGNPLDTTLTYNFMDFMPEQLYTDNHPCVAGSSWDIVAADNEYYGLTDCKLFTGNGLPFSINTSDVTFETITYGGLPSIKRINIDFDISTPKGALEAPIDQYMKEFVAAVAHAKKMDIQNVSGMHEFDFYDLDADAKVTRLECLGIDRCGIRVAIDTMASDGSQYLKLTGSNFMRGNLAFSEDPDDVTNSASLSDCYVWYYDANTSAWTGFDPTPGPTGDVDFENQDNNPDQVSLPCGVRYDTVSDGTPGGSGKVINLASSTLTANEAISINSNCKFTDFDNERTTGNAYYKENEYVKRGEFSCGIFKDMEGGTPFVIAVVNDFYADTINADQANLKNIKSVDLESDRVKTNLIEELTNASAMEIIGTNLRIDMSGINIDNDNFTVTSTNKVELRGNVVDIDGADIANSRLRIGGVSLAMDGTGRTAATTLKEIDDFLNPKEFISKEYVDSLVGVLVRWKGTLQLGEQLDGEATNAPTIAANQYRVCPSTYTEKYEVSPVITYGEPITVTYGLTKTGTGANTVLTVTIDKDQASSISVPWPTGSTRPWANVTVYCI
jgi:prepilin-type N-terminal cleavage/methylation domain-containing protein